MATAPSDRYVAFVTACLQQGPMTRAQLQVPQRALEQLHRLGHIAPRTHVTGCIATQWWYLPEQLPPREPAPKKQPSVASAFSPPLWSCAAMTFDGI